MKGEKNGTISGLNIIIIIKVMIYKNELQCPVEDYGVKIIMKNFKKNQQQKTLFIILTSIVKQNCYLLNSRD